MTQPSEDVGGSPRAANFSLPAASMVKSASMSISTRRDR
jgi:hypothetical protein